jgi:hypothetical protein
MLLLLQLQQQAVSFLGVPNWPELQCRLSVVVLQLQC